ncbi:hypothetical protein PIROE2DRAFT_10100 [Piromyces sp. E2]|nr:hypothetical protein PIROE2DRAFT_10100 [Piromyces sp. E2]|eukprot:OUM63380.1 hypothetical protein PIROE2DRAFT_10100 [Piromyces sp. E2]
MPAINIQRLSNVRKVLVHFIDASNGKHIITCDASQCSSTTHKGSDTSPKHYLEAAASNNKVITCIKDSCFYEDSSINGYFVNSEDNATYKIITCNSSSGCALPTASEKTDCATAKAGGYIVKSGSSYLCISDDDSDKVQIKIGATEGIYKITIATNDDFPGSTTGDIHVKIYKDGSAILLKDAELKECGNTYVNGIYGLDSTKEKIIYVYYSNNIE